MGCVSKESTNSAHQVLPFSYLFGVKPLLFVCLLWRLALAQPLSDYLPWYATAGLDSLHQLRQAELRTHQVAVDSLALARWVKDIAVDRVRYQADYQAAAEINRRAIAWAARLGDADLHSACLNNQGVFFMQLGQYAAATDAYQQSLTLNRARGDTASLAKGLHNLGNLFLFQQDLAAALPAYREALALNRQRAAWRSAAKNLLSIASVFAQQNQHDSAQYHVRRLFALCAAHDTLTAGALPWLIMGDIYNETNQPDSAFWAYTRGLARAEAEQSLQHVLRALQALGKWHIYQEEYPAAQAYLRDALQRMGTRPLNLRLYLLGDLGMACKHLGQLDSARRYYRQALDLAATWQQARPALSYGTSLANLERRDGRPTVAVALLRPMLDDPVTAQDPYWQGKIRCELGLALAELGQWTQARPLLQAALPLAETYGEWEDLRGIHGALAERAAAQGQAQAVLRHMQQRQRWQDSILAQRYADNLAELRTRYETDRKTQQLDALALQQALTEANLTRTRRARNALLAVVLGLLLAGALVAWLLLRVRRQRRQIAAQSSKLQALNQTKDRLFALIAHDLAGPVASFEELNRLYQHHLRQGRTEPLHALGEQVARQSQQLRLLLDNLLQWALQQMRAYRAKPETVALPTLLHEQAELFQARAAEKGLALRVDAPAGLAWHGDTMGLRIALSNLLANAVKFADQGEISLHARESDRGLHLSVRDQGPGMSAERVAEVLAGQTVHPRPGSQGEKGAGLGLSFVQAWAQQQGGKLHIDSHLGHGTSVTLALAGEST